MLGCPASLHSHSAWFVRRHGFRMSLSRIISVAKSVELQGWHVPRSGGTAADIFALGLVLLEARLSCCR